MNKPKTQRNKQIEDLYNQGYSLSEIADRFQIGRERARQIVEKRKKDRKEFRRLEKLKKEGGF